MRINLNFFPIFDRRFDLFSFHSRCEFFFGRSITKQEHIKMEKFEKIENSSINHRQEIREESLAHHKNIEMDFCRSKFTDGPKRSIQSFRLDRFWKVHKNLHPLSNFWSKINDETIIYYWNLKRLIKSFYQNTNSHQLDSRTRR